MLYPVASKDFPILKDCTKNARLEFLERDSLSLKIVSIVGFYSVLFAFKASPTRTGAQTLGVAISTVPGKLRITCCSGVGCHLSHAKKKQRLSRICKNFSCPACLDFLNYKMGKTNVLKTQLYETRWQLTPQSFHPQLHLPSQDPSTSTTPLHTSRAKSNSVPVKLPPSCVDVTAM